MKDDENTCIKQYKQFEKEVNKYIKQYNDRFSKYDTMNVLINDNTENIKFDVNLMFKLEKDIHQIKLCIGNCIQLNTFEECNNNNNKNHIEIQNQNHKYNQTNLMMQDEQKDTEITYNTATVFEDTSYLSQKSKKQKIKKQTTETKNEIKKKSITKGTNISKKHLCMKCCNYFSKDNVLRLGGCYHIICKSCTKSHISTSLQFKNTNLFFVFVSFFFGVPKVWIGNHMF